MAIRTGLTRLAITGAGLAAVIGLAAPAAHAADAHTPTTTTAAAATTTVAAKPVTVKTVAAPAPAKPTVALPTATQLMPLGTPSGQSTISISASQMGNAAAIVKEGQALKLPPRAWVIAVATSMQETKLVNYGNLGSANDHDSLGLFQQRPSSGWGPATDLVKPTFAAGQFYKALTQVHGWDKLPLTQAAQDVQVSAFGDRYAQWELQASKLVTASIQAEAAGK